jgi:DNA-binding response OmpR family regulator
MSDARSTPEPSSASEAPPPTPGPVIILIEDEAEIRRFLRATLPSHGYRLVEAVNAQEGLQAAETRQPDLIILDLGLPDMDGLEVIRRLREWTQVPVLVLSARGQEADKVAALDAGADDYVTKPFVIEELAARIRARLRWRDEDRSQLKAGPVTVDLVAHRAVLDGREVPLSARELTLLATFMRHTGQVLSRSQLLDLVWGMDFDPGSNVVDGYVAALRRKIGAPFIETVRGLGYRFVVPDIREEHAR